jgi:hypothetical protein
MTRVTIPILRVSPLLRIACDAAEVIEYASTKILEVQER